MRGKRVSNRGQTVANDKQSGPAKGRKKKIDSSPVPFLASTALETADIIQANVSRKDVVRPTVANKKVEVAEEMLPYYTFGVTTCFLVPVHLIVSPPSTMNHRMLNNEHVKTIYKSMVRFSTLVPTTTDLLPYSPMQKRSLSFKNTTEDYNALLSYIKEESILFLAISGQHSAAAAQRIIEDAKTSATLRGIGEQLKYRNSRILSCDTPIDVLAKHSFNSNEANKTTTFKSPFMERI